MPQHSAVATTETNFNVKASLSTNRVRGLWNLLDGYRIRYIGAAGLLAIAALSNTASLLLLRFVVDDILVNPSEAFLLWLVFSAAAFLGLNLIRGTFSFFQGALTAEVTEGIGVRLKDFMFDHLQHLNFTYHDGMATGELIQRSTSDIQAVQRMFGEQIIGIGRISMLFLVNFIAIAWLSLPLALFTASVVPVIAILSLFFFSRVSKAYEAFQEQDEVVQTRLQENLSGVRVVKAFARQPYEIERFEVENREKFRKGMSFMRLFAMYWPLTDLLTGLTFVGGYLLGALLVINSELTVLGITMQGISLGDYVAYTLLAGWIINPMRNLGRLIVQLSEGMVSYDRLAEVMQEEWELLEKDVTPPVERIRGHIQYENIHFAYEQGIPVLKNISFTVEAGQTVALLGSTGSGKTTLMNLLTRFYDLQDGRISIDGHPLEAYPKYFLRRQIGLVEQEPFLFSRSIRENITYGVHREVSDEEVHAAAKLAAVHDVIMEFSEGYQTLVGERGVTLSGGQKQRVALARVLLKNPSVLVLDDATSSVDTETESQIREALGQLGQSRTTFVIAHRIQSVMSADLILVLDHGEIVQSGTHQELMQVDGIYRQTYDLQSKIEEDLQEELALVQ